MEKKKFLQPVSILIAALVSSIAQFEKPALAAQVNNLTPEEGTGYNTVEGLPIPDVATLERTADGDLLLKRHGSHSSHSSHSSHASHASHYSSHFTP